MKHYRIAISSLAVVGVLLIGGCSSSGSDKGTNASSTTAAGGGVKVTTPADTTTVNVDVGDTKGLDGPMTMTVSTATAKSGSVTFVMKNSGTIEHEMIVFKTDTPVGELTVEANDRVSEADSVGEVSETAAGKTKSITLDLKPGKYALACNIAKHYKMGMYAPFTVT